ncbi:hypothetical protein [Streptomyces triticisoli]|jgi:hypothetical protein|uniref:hypothetical protein n=1 Tax=Streptomyces triticisoli TaxID=2182797 RepID=UPI000DD8BB5E|nr:hypothetical protein [Streptomyces triticisoli]
MSYGDPNNPYGAPQQPSQPGYGAPQGQAPGYGYPQAPPVQQPYGAPVPQTMPGTVKAARVMLFILGGFQALGGLLMMVASAWFADKIQEAVEADSSVSAADADKVASIGAGVMIVVGVIVLAFAFWAIFTAVKFTTGRGGARVSAIVYSSVIILFSVINLLGANVFALISLVLGILIIVFCANKAGGAWFNRPSY